MEAQVHSGNVNIQHFSPFTKQTERSMFQFFHIQSNVITKEFVHAWLSCLASGVGNVSSVSLQIIQTFGSDKIKCVDNNFMRLL